jgi:hypothetical protein
VLSGYQLFSLSGGEYVDERIIHGPLSGKHAGIAFTTFSSIRVIREIRGSINLRAPHGISPARVAEFRHSRSSAIESSAEFQRKSPENRVCGSPGIFGTRPAISGNHVEYYDD